MQGLGLAGSVVSKILIIEREFGERITVILVPARDGTKHLGWISKITYADGRYYALGGAMPLQ